MEQSSILFFDVVAFFLGLVGPLLPVLPLPITTVGNSALVPKAWFERMGEADLCSFALTISLLPCSRQPLLH